MAPLSNQQSNTCIDRNNSVHTYEPRTAFLINPHSIIVVDKTTCLSNSLKRNEKDGIKSLYGHLETETKSAQVAVDSRLFLTTKQI